MPFKKRNPKRNYSINSGLAHFNLYFLSDAFVKQKRKKKHNESSGFKNGPPPTHKAKKKKKKMPHLSYHFYLNHD